MEKELMGLPSVDKPWLKWYSEEAKRQTVPHMRNYDYMLYWNQHNFENTALNYFGRKIPYAELVANIEKAMASFQSMGIKEGDIVTFCMPTVPETIYSLYALNRLGAVAAMIDPTTNNERIKNFIDLFDSKYLMMADLAQPKLDAMLKETKLEKVIVISPMDSLSPIMRFGYQMKKMISDIKKETNKLTIPYGDYYMAWEDFQKLGEKTQVMDVPYRKDAPAAIVLTSGTTGVPKGAILSNENLNVIALEQGYCTNMRKNDTFLNIMPPFIAYGLVCGITNVLCNGLEMIIVPKFEKRSEKDIVKGDIKLDKSSTFDTLIAKYHPNHILGVPNFYLQLIASSKMNEKNLASIKGAIAGGDTFHTHKEQLVNDFLQAHHAEWKINKGYGMTELCSVATYTCLDSVNKLGSVGIPVMMNNAKIIDIETGEELGYNQIGELYMTGPGVILGYFGNPCETAKTFITDENGIRWVKTGDLFSMDEDGVLYFKGRIKRMMVRPDGHNVFNEPIEEVLLSHEDIEDCAVIGLPDNSGTGEIPTAIIVLKKECSKCEDEIVQELKELSQEKLPERDVALNYIFRASLPYTTVSKVNYLELAEEGKRMHLIANEN